MRTKSKKRIAVFGLGYVGCVTAACLARRGHSIIGVDSNPAKVASIQLGKSPVAEPGLMELVASEVHQGRLKATSSAADAVAASDMAFVTVGTPSRHDGDIEIAMVVQVVDEIVASLDSSRHYTIVIRSTLLPGILEEHLFPRTEHYPLLTICNHPEFLREVTAIEDFENPPLVVVGAKDASCGRLVMQLYDDFCCPKVITDTRTASMVKYASNAYHALKIAFANEIGALSKALDIDGQKVMEIACMDQQLNVSSAYLKPGFAFGGSCLPKDLRALRRAAQLAAVQTSILDSILPSNQIHLERALELIQSHKLRQIGLLGLSFKPGTDDLRESPMIVLAESLLGKGYDLRIHDPDVLFTTLVGSNRSYVHERLPHLAQLLCEPEEFAAHCQLMVVGTARSVPESLRHLDCTVISLENTLVSGDLRD